MNAFAFTLVLLCWLIFVSTVIADLLPDRFVDKLFRRLNGGKPFEPYDKD
jgi:hypothetical protein